MWDGERGGVSGRWWRPSRRWNGEECVSARARGPVHEKLQFLNGTQSQYCRLAIKRHNTAKSTNQKSSIKSRTTKEIDCPLLREIWICASSLRGESRIATSWISLDHVRSFRDTSPGPSRSLQSNLPFFVKKKQSTRNYCNSRGEPAKYMIKKRCWFSQIDFFGD